MPSSGLHVHSVYLLTHKQNTHKHLTKRNKPKKKKKKDLKPDQKILLAAAAAQTPWDQSKDSGQFTGSERKHTLRMFLLANSLFVSLHCVLLVLNYCLLPLTC